jgi:peptide alpha-N-acetyltransferase
MLAVQESYRGKGIATKLVCMAIDTMVARDADEVALETEVTNTASLKLYERLGFIRSKRLHRYYLNGNAAFRLILYLKEGTALKRPGEGEEMDHMQPKFEVYRGYGPSTGKKGIPVDAESII